MNRLLALLAWKRSERCQECFRRFPPESLREGLCAVCEFDFENERWSV